MEMLVSEAAPGAALKVELQGRLDTAGVDRVETRFIAAVVASGRDTMVDLSGVELITSMGLRMLISAGRAMSQRRTRIVLFGARDAVREVLQTAAIDTLIALVAGEHDARPLVGL